MHRKSACEGSLSLVDFLHPSPVRLVSDGAAQLFCFQDFLFKLLDLKKANTDAIRKVPAKLKAHYFFYRTGRGQVRGPAGVSDC